MEGVKNILVLTDDVPNRQGHAAGIQTALFVSHVMIPIAMEDKVSYL
jgi:hypothetical protein